MLRRIQHVHFWERPLPRVAGEDRIDRRPLRDLALEKLRTAKRSRRVAPAASPTAPWWEREALALIARIAGRAADEGVG